MFGKFFRIISVNKQNQIYDTRCSFIIFSNQQYNLSFQQKDMQEQFHDDFRQIDQLIEKTKKKLAYQCLSINNDKLYTSLVECLSFIKCLGIENEVAKNCLDVIESISKKKEEASFMIEIIQNLKDYLGPNKQDAYDIRPKCLQKCRQMFLEVEIMNLIRVKKRRQYSKQSKDYLKNIKLSQTLKNLLSQFYEINKDELFQINNYLQDISFEEQFIDHQQINTRFTITKAFLCLFVFLQTLMKITPQEQKRREELQEKRALLIENLQLYQKDHGPQFYSLQIKNRIDYSEKNYNLRQSNQILRLFNNLFILDLLQASGSNRTIKNCKILKKQIKQDYKSGYNLWLLCKKGWTESVFQKHCSNENTAIDRQLAQIIGWQNQVNLVRDMAEGLLQLQQIGILQTDLKFANKVQIGQHYYLIDFDNAYKLAYSDDHKKYPMQIDKNNYLSRQHLNLTKEQSIQRYNQYINALFQTKYQSYYQFAGKILDSLKLKNLMSFLYFPLPEECIYKEHSQMIKERISKSHVLQFAHILEPIFNFNPNHPDNVVYFKVEQIKKLIKSAKQSQQDVRMSMSKFYQSFNHIVYNGNPSPTSQHLQQLYLWQLGSVQKYCSKCLNSQDQTQQFAYIFIQRQKDIQNSFLCDQCAEGIKEMQFHNQKILINRKSPFARRQQINFSLIINNKFYRQNTFNPQVFFSQNLIQVQILKLCIMIDIFSKASQQEPDLAQKQIFYRLEFFIQKMLNEKQNLTLYDFLYYYICYDQQKDFEKDKKERQYIKDKYYEYPFQSVFEMPQNRDQINILNYNDRLLIKIYDEVIRYFVKDYRNVYVSIKDTVRSLNVFIMRLRNQTEFDVDDIKNQIRRMFRSFKNWLKTDKQLQCPITNQNSFSCYQKVIKVLIQNQMKKIMHNHAILLNTFCKYLGKIIKQSKQWPIANRIDQLLEKTQKQLKIINYDKLAFIKQFQKSVINNELFLSLFKFKKLKIEQTYAISCKLNYNLLRKTIEQDRKIWSKMKFHQFSSEGNCLLSGTVYFSQLDPQEKICEDFKIFRKSKKALDALYFKGKKQDSLFIKDKDGNFHRIQQEDEEEQEINSESDNSDEDGGDQDDQSQYQGQSQESDWVVDEDTNHFNIIIDQTIKMQARFLKNLLLSNIEFNSQNSNKLKSLLIKASNLQLFGLKYCSNFQSIILQAINPNIRSIDFKNVQFVKPFQGLYLKDKAKLTNLTIQQMNSNSSQPQIMDFHLQYLKSLKYLSLKWFTNKKKNQDYFMALQKNPNLQQIEHLTLKTHTISKNVIDLVSKMTSLKSLSLKAHFFGVQLSQLIFTLSELKSLITLKIQEQDQFFYHKSQDLNQQQLDRIDKLNENISHQQPDSSDDSSRSLPQQFDSWQVRNQNSGNTFCDQQLDSILKNIFNQYKKLKFLRLFVNAGKCFITQFSPILCKLQLWKDTISQDTKQKLFRQGVILYQRTKD